MITLGLIFFGTPFQKSIENSDDALLQFYKEDYKLKVDYLTDHFSRMWTRFNFFITIETAIFSSSAFLGIFQNQTGSFDSDRPFILAAVVGIVVSLFWYMFGVQDRYVAAVYRRQVKAALEAIDKRLKELPEGYYYVGQTEETSALGIETNLLYQWRSKHLSTTKLAAWFPLAVLAMWGSLFVALTLPHLIRIGMW